MKFEQCVTKREIDGQIIDKKHQYLQNDMTDEVYGTLIDILVEFKVSAVVLNTVLEHPKCRKNNLFRLFNEIGKLKSSPVVSIWNCFFVL